MRTNSEQLFWIVIVYVLLTLLALNFNCKSPASPEDNGTDNGQETELNRDVYMQGRSVMRGWFDHWGWDGNDNNPVTHGRFSLFHRDVSSPSLNDQGASMINSVRANVNEIANQNSPIVFFKFCFVDFNAGSHSHAQSLLNLNQNIVQEVYRIVVQDHGYPLIIGNALPMTANNTNAHVKWLHKQFNSWLNTFKNLHSGEVFVFDLYSILSDSQGNLRAGYAVGAWDSHLNEAAYSALDTPFFNLLENNF